MSLLEKIELIDQKLVNLYHDLNNVNFENNLPVHQPVFPKNMKKVIADLFAQRDFLFLQHRRAEPWILWEDLADLYGRDLSKVPFYPGVKHNINDWANPKLERLSEPFKKSIKKEKQSYIAFFDHLNKTDARNSLLNKLFWIDQHSSHPFTSDGKNKRASRENDINLSNKIQEEFKKEYKTEQEYELNELQAESQKIVEELLYLRESATKSKKSLEEVNIIKYTSEMPGVTYNFVSKKWEARKVVFCDKENSCVCIFFFTDERRKRVENSLQQFCVKNKLSHTSLKKDDREQFEKSWNAPAKKMDKKKISGGMTSTKNVRRVDDYEDYLKAKRAEKRNQEHSSPLTFYNKTAVKEWIKEERKDNPSFFNFLDKKYLEKEQALKDLERQQRRNEKEFRAEDDEFLKILNDLKKGEI